MRVEQEKKTGNVESVTLEQVPMEERKSWADVAMIQAGIMICVPWEESWQSLCRCLRPSGQG